MFKNLSAKARDYRNNMPVNHALIGAVAIYAVGIAGAIATQNKINDMMTIDE